VNLPPKALLILPGSVYAVSYLYLAGYHGDLFLFDNVVHEGGTHTLLETIFYFSHFLGHVPVHTVLALFFVGTWMCLTPSDPDTPLKRRTGPLWIAIAALLCVSVLLSLVVFGPEDTLSFVFQQKQAVGVYRQGGSWNLHLPSTVSLFFLVPVYLFVTNILFGPGNAPGRGGRLYLLLGLFLFLLVTVLCNLGDLMAPLSLWTDPRYLAHSVRELLTFPLTYFPIPLYFFYRGRGRPGGKKTGGRLLVLIACLAAVFLAGLFYQSYLPLSAGIGELAQKPAFAGAGRLSIAYLLASHYFEHVLDSLYFALLCLLLYGYAMKRKSRSEAA
jgi:hypothetical protein